jgi:predicted AlkP superfamily phosphohydrolase/phosphomutase
VIGRQRWLKAALRRLLPQKTQEKAKSVAESVSGQIIEWSETRAYTVPIYFHVCGVEINLAGARREGIVQPGSEYEELRDSIIAEAQRLVDPQSQRPVVDLAARREDVFAGPNVKQFPDVILVLDPDYVAASSLAGRSLYEPHSASRPGEHRQEGMFIASGPSIVHESGMTGLRLLDVPPTLLYALGLPVPSDLDGRVLEEIFEPEHLKACPVQVVDSLEDQSPFALTDSSPAAGLSEEEEESIAQRLKGLGYLD